MKTPVFIKTIQKIFAGTNALTVLKVTTGLLIATAVLFVVGMGILGAFGVLKLRKKIEERRLELYYSKRKK